MVKPYDEIDHMSKHTQGVPMITLYVVNIKSKQIELINRIELTISILIVNQTINIFQIAIITNIHKNTK